MIQEDIGSQIKKKIRKDSINIYYNGAEKGKIATYYNTVGSVAALSST